MWKKYSLKTYSWMNALREVLIKKIILFKKVLSEEESQEIEKST